MELKNKKWTEEEFFAVREKVLASWKTGNDDELQLDKAIEYLTVATYMAKENNENYDFTELIDKLKGNTTEETKPRFIMQEKDFANDLDNYYGITNFDELNNIHLF